MNQTVIVKSNPDSRRLPALDAVRGLAVIGMLIQHFALQPWNDFVSGNTMILFMLCSGISYTLMIRGMQDHGYEKPAIRSRVLARAFFLDFTGYALIMLNGQFGVVLPAYAMMFLLALPLIKCKTKTLTLMAAVSFLLCPPLMLIGMSLLSGAGLLYDVAGGPGSAVAWIPVFITGMAIGRINLRESKNAIRLAGIGLAVGFPVKLFSLAVLPGLYHSVLDWLAQNSASAAMTDAL